MKRKKNLLRMIILIKNWVPKFPKQTEYILFKMVVQENVKRESEGAREKKKKSRRSFRKSKLVVYVFFYFT